MNIHIILIASIVHADDLKNAYSFQTIPIFLLPIRKNPKTWFSLSSCEVQILLSYTQFQSCTFWQRYPTTNAQDKSSSVMVWKHLWFPPALRCDLLDAPLSLWWWRNRSCTFSSLKKTTFPETETDAFSAFEKLAFVPGNSYQSLVFLFICLFLDLKSLLCSD